MRVNSSLQCQAGDSDPGMGRKVDRLVVIVESHAARVAHDELDRGTCVDALLSPGLVESGEHHPVVAITHLDPGVLIELEIKLALPRSRFLRSGRRSGCIGLGWRGLD